MQRVPIHVAQDCRACVAQFYISGGMYPTIYMMLCTGCAYVYMMQDAVLSSHFSKEIARPMLREAQIEKSRLVLKCSEALAPPYRPFNGSPGLAATERTH